ncbi:MAG: shikimate dehydrogenase [Gammaproteobacteria bacterium]|jgi:shikimate dehydrogenase
MSSLFDFDRSPDEYAVMGNPVSHSKSPLIHTLFAEQTGQRIRYRAIQVDPGGFAQAVGNFFATGGKGLNITVPFKQEGWQLTNQCSDRAQLAGAVNTLKPLPNNELFGDNTDGIGLVRDLTDNLGITLKGQRLLLIGAGGAARGVISPLLETHPARLVLANRTADRAHDLAGYFTNQLPQYKNIEAQSFDDLENESFDVVINATSASLSGELPPIPASAVNQAEMVYDMMYAARPTAFLQWALQQGAKRISDGLGMLVEQAAESFFIWRNAKPETAMVIKSVRDSL